ncbi:hypothetical protein K438DRAFT_535691, partial [Mycena galopus ATCC 62051]
AKLYDDSIKEIPPAARRPGRAGFRVGVHSELIDGAAYHCGGPCVHEENRQNRRVERCHVQWFVVPTHLKEARQGALDVPPYPLGASFFKVAFDEPYIMHRLDRA